ncbi:unnamed protein product, partial [Meganyctiphanes norvegica]
MDVDQKESNHREESNHRGRTGRRDFLHHCWKIILNTGESVGTFTYVLSYIKLGGWNGLFASVVSDQLSLFIIKNWDIVISYQINGIDTKRFTPLNIACQEGHTGVVKKLLKAGADRETPSKDGFQPLHTACQRGFIIITELLID